MIFEIMVLDGENLISHTILPYQNGGENNHFSAPIVKNGVSHRGYTVNLKVHSSKVDEEQAE